MKHSTLLRQLLFLFLAATATSQAELLIPGEDDGPHANKAIIFDGTLNFWANELYGFKEGREVIFENAGKVTIGEKVIPQSVLVKGNSDTIWSGTGQIAGNTSVIKEGAGALFMNPSNSYTGGTLIKEGSVTAGSADSFGTGTIEISGGLLNLSGYEITNEIRISGGQIQGATAIHNQLIFCTDYTIAQDTAIRNIRLQDGVALRVAEGVTLSTEEKMVLSKTSTLDLSAGGMFNGGLEVGTDGILRLANNGTTPISPNSVWHLNAATINGNLSTAASGNTARAGSTLRISGNCRIRGALTLSGGTLRFSDNHAILHTETLVLNSPTNLITDNPLTPGNSRNFLTYNRLISDTATNYYDFFGVDAEQYELTVTAQGISLTPRTAATTPEPPNDSPAEDIPGADTGTDETPNNGSSGKDTPADTDDNSHGAPIDTSGNTAKDPHNNENSASENDNSPSNTDNRLTPECGTALSQAAMQSAWGARFAAHAFMTAVYDNSRREESATWAAFCGGLRETEDDGTIPGGDITVCGLALGAEAHPTKRTQLGLALGGALGSISGGSFGELDQLSLHAAAYIGHSFLQQDSRYRLNLYSAICAGRTDTDPGIYSGLENWHHNTFSLHSRLSWGKKLSRSLSWEIYGGAEYYRGSGLSVGEEYLCALSALSGSIGSGIAWSTRQATVYAEAEFTGDIVRDSPTARSGGNEYRTAAPDRCGIRLSCGLQLHPETTERSIRLHYSIETRSNSTAHIINAGFTRVF